MPIPVDRRRISHHQALERRRRARRELEAFTRRLSILLGALVGVVLLGALSMKTARSASAPSGAVQVASLYWQFVDAIWIVIFTVLYLLPTIPRAR